MRVSLTSSIRQTELKKVSFARNGGVVGFWVSRDFQKCLAATHYIPVGVVKILLAYL